MVPAPSFSVIMMQEWQIHNHRIVAVEQHHEVLFPWAELRRATGRAARALTLDHHTDVLEAFSHCGGARPGDFDRVDAASVSAAIARLRHDEHLDWALRSGILAESWVLAHENFTVPAHPAMHLLHDPEWPEEMVMLNDSSVYRPFADQVLESDFLRRILPETLLHASDEMPLILDIDLDYFATAQAIRPVEPSVFGALARRSMLITLSLESDWVRLLRLEEETISGEFLLQEMIRLLTAVLAEDY